MVDTYKKTHIVKKGGHHAENGIGKLGIPLTDEDKECLKRCDEPFFLYCMNYKATDAIKTLAKRSTSLR